MKVHIYFLFDSDRSGHQRLMLHRRNMRGLKMAKGKFVICKLERDCIETDDVIKLMAESEYCDVTKRIYSV